MPASDLVNLSGLMGDAKCFALVRQHRQPEGARCPVCDSGAVIRDGCDDTQSHRQQNHIHCSLSMVNSSMARMVQNFSKSAKVCTSGSCTRTSKLPTGFA